MARIGIIGSEVRMGHALAAAIEAAGATFAGGIDKGGNPEALAKVSEVLVDFSSPHALEANLDAAVTAGVPIVTRTPSPENGRTTTPRRSSPSPTSSVASPVASHTKLP